MLRQDGINASTWDRVAAGMTVTRRGVEIKVGPTPSGLQP
jgi:hypothetical protein